MKLRRSRRAVGAAFLLAGFVSAGASVATFQAAPAAAVELSSFDLRANANGFSFFNDDASGARQGEGTVPHTEANLQNGPVGNGLATVFWPGPLAANAGTLILVLQPSAPDAAKQLNYPVRAESRPGDNPPTKTYEVPGTKLTSTAEAQKVSADAVIASPVSDTGAAGTTQSHSLVQQTDQGGSAESSSKVQDFVLGPIKIESVVSTAKATTDGTKADGSATTTITGMTVAGQPAYVDESGLRIGQQGQPANAIANQIAQQALAQGGFNVYVSTPQKEVNGASVSVTAGSIYITQKSDSGITGFSIGGAHAQATAAPGDPSLLDTGGAVDGGSGLGGGSLSDFGSGSLTDSGSSLGSTDTGTGTGSTSGARSGAGTGTVALDARNASSGGKPIKPAAVVFGVLGALALYAGLRRLSDDVLAERAAQTSCSLEAGA